MISAANTSLVHQGHLENVLHKLFSSDNILSNVRQEGEIRSPITGKFLELDLWIPTQFIAFEFQDVYHYTNTWDSQIPLSLIQEKDSHKLAEVRRKNETLVLVPCWWNGLSDSLMATVNFYRPDLFENKILNTDELPISLNPPEEFFTMNKIPEVGELMLASFPPSTTEFSNSLSPTNSWWMGEKYDGIRFCWNFKIQKMFSRTGFTLSCPLSFFSHFPTSLLDGEVWFGRGNFHDAQRVVSSNPSEMQEWAYLRILVFDVPLPNSKLNFEKRYEILLNVTFMHHPFIMNAVRVMCKSKIQLSFATKDILKDGGEGVILRKPNTLYEKGRSTNLYKFKASRGDKEGLVVTVKLASHTCTLLLPDGRTIEATLNKMHPKNRKTIKKGDIVTFEYDTFSRYALPINPSVTRVRFDLSWPDILLENSKNSLSSLSVPSSSALGVPSNSYSSNRDKRKLFFETFAKKNNFNPQVPDNWYTVSRKDIFKMKGASSIMGYYNGSLINALLDLFPNIGLVKTKFTVLPNRYWQSFENRRKFFIEYAKLKRFDPFSARFWYSVSKNQLLQYKGALSVLEFYEGSLSTALVNLFPEIGLDSSLFDDSVAVNGAQSNADQQNFFNKFAQHYNFDPLQLSGWYKHAGKVLSFKGAKTTLHQNNGDVVKSLIQVFTDFKIHSAQLFSSYQKYWQDLLLSFARNSNFDPSVPDNWYHMTRDKDITFQTDTGELLIFPREFVIRELFNVFPFIGLEQNKFSFLSGKYSVNEDTRRQFFKRVAKLKGFDPEVTENWYQISRQDIIPVKGASAVLAHYKGSFVTALKSLFPNLHLQEHKFANLSRNHWHVQHNRRVFFDEFAKRNKFDPLHMEEWLKLNKTDIYATKGGSSVMKYYDYSLPLALKTVYPDMQPQNNSNLQIQKQVRKLKPVSARHYFDKIAKQEGFDPLFPDNWYQYSDGSLDKEGILDRFGGSMVMALREAYPEIEFHELKFVK